MMIFKIIWNKSAETDLNEIIDYIIDNEGINTAFDIFTKIKNKSELLANNPELGRIVPELKMFTNKYRELIIKPWRIVYRTEENTVKILLIIDGRRNTEDLLYEKLLKFN